MSYDTPDGKHYLLVGECGFKIEPFTDEQYRRNLNLGICFVRANLGDPPDGFTLEVIWARYTSDYQIVALGWNAHQTLTPEAQAYATEVENLFILFDLAVDWSAISMSALSAASQRVTVQLPDPAAG